METLLPRNVPVVLVNSPSATGARYAFHIDNYGGARSIVGHLVAHGHRRIALTRGPARNADARERLRGYRAALRDGGLPTAPELEVDGDFRSGTGYAAVATVLRLAPRPTAIFAANDAMALGALSGLRDAGVSVPEQVALVGFDDLSSTEYAVPPLTTMHIPISELGERAVAYLAETAAGGAPSRRRRKRCPPRS